MSQESADYTDQQVIFTKAYFKQTQGEKKEKKRCNSNDGAQKVSIMKTRDMRKGAPSLWKSIDGRF